jgi:short-subunit dehydrogenase
VVNVGSSAGFLPLPAMAVYGATKAYVESLSHALAAEWHDRGIRVTCVCPGPVRTQFQEVAAIPDPLAPDLLMADPADVVARAIEDARRGRPTSIYGMTVRIYGWMAQILPRNAVPRLGHLVFRKIPGRSRVPADN